MIRRCCRCGKATRSAKSSLCHSPPYLFIQLDRCKHDSAKSRKTPDGSVVSVQYKVATNVSYPLTNLDLTLYVREDCREENSALYDLVGVACHSGTLNAGHYRVMCFDNVDGSGKWYSYNDAEVKEVSPKDVETAEACALLYARKGTHSALDVVHFLSNHFCVCYKQENGNADEQCPCSPERACSRESRRCFQK